MFRHLPHRRALPLKTANYATVALPLAPAQENSIVYVAKLVLCRDIQMLFFHLYASRRSSGGHPGATQDIPAAGESAIIPSPL